MKQIIRSWTAISVRSSRSNPIHQADCASVKKDLQTASPNVSIISLCTCWLLRWKYLIYSLSCNYTGLWRCTAFLLDMSSFIRKYKLSIIVSSCTTELCVLVLRCPDSVDDLNLTEELGGEFIVFILTGVGVVPLAQDAIHTPFHKNGPLVSTNCAVVAVLSTKCNLTCERLNWDNQHSSKCQRSTSEIFLVGFSSIFVCFIP